MAIKRPAKRQKENSEKSKKKLVTIGQLANELLMDRYTLIVNLYRDGFIKRLEGHYTWPEDHPDVGRILRIYQYHPTNYRYQSRRLPLITVKHLAYEFKIHPDKIRRLLKQAGFKRPSTRWAWIVDNPDLEKIRALLKEEVEKTKKKEEAK